MTVTGRPLAVLVVEDDARLREILTSHLVRMGCSVRGAAGADAALRQLEAAPADVVISDVRMSGMDGRALLTILRERFPATHVVLMTAFGSTEQATEATRAGARAYVCKPFKIEVIAALLRDIAGELGVASAS